MKPLLVIARSWQLLLKKGPISQRYKSSKLLVLCGSPLIGLPHAKVRVWCPTCLNLLPQSCQLGSCRFFFFRWGPHDVDIVLKPSIHLIRCGGQKFWLIRLINQSRHQKDFVLDSWRYRCNRDSRSTATSSSLPWIFVLKFICWKSSSKSQHPSCQSPKQSNLGGLNGRKAVACRGHGGFDNLQPLRSEEERPRARGSVPGSPTLAIQAFHTSSPTPKWFLAAATSVIVCSCAHAGKRAIDTRTKQVRKLPSLWPFFHLSQNGPATERCFSHPSTLSNNSVFLFWDCFALSKNSWTKCWILMICLVTFFCQKRRSGKPTQCYLSVPHSLSQKVGLDPTNIKDTPQSGPLGSIRSGKKQHLQRKAQVLLLPPVL